LPIGLGTDGVQLTLNVGVDLGLASESETPSQQPDAQLVPVCVVCKLLDEFSPDVCHCVHYSAVWLNFAVRMSARRTLAGCQSSDGRFVWFRRCTAFRNPESPLCCTTSHRHITAGNYYHLCYYHFTAQQVSASKEMGGFCWHKASLPAWCMASRDTEFRLCCTALHHHTGAG